MDTSNNLHDSSNHKPIEAWKLNLSLIGLGTSFGIFGALLGAADLWISGEWPKQSEPVPAVEPLTREVKAPAPNLESWDVSESSSK